MSKQHTTACITNYLHLVYTVCRSFSAVEYGLVTDNIMHIVVSPDKSAYYFYRWFSCKKVAKQDHLQVAHAYEPIAQPRQTYFLYENKLRRQSDASSDPHYNTQPTTMLLSFSIAYNMYYYGDSTGCSWGSGVASNSLIMVTVLL